MDWMRGDKFPLEKQVTNRYSLEQIDEARVALAMPATDAVAFAVGVVVKERAVIMGWPLEQQRALPVPAPRTVSLQAQGSAACRLSWLLPDACPVCTQPLTPDRLAAAFGGR
jgi:hypothetical protein